METTSPQGPRSTEVIPTGCCAPFDPATWDEREVTWHDRLFVKERVQSLFHIPLNMGRKLTRAMQKIDAAEAATAQQLMLSDERSPWRSELFIDVTKPVPGAEMATLSGTFLTKVYDGPFSAAPQWAKDMRQHVAQRGRVLEKIYFAYTTCPSCAKAYGHNYVVLFAQVAEQTEAGPSIAQG